MQVGRFCTAQCSLSPQLFPPAARTPAQGYPKHTLQNSLKYLSPSGYRCLRWSDRLFWLLSSWLLKWLLQQTNEECNHGNSFLWSHETTKARIRHGGGGEKNRCNCCTTLPSTAAHTAISVLILFQMSQRSSTFQEFAACFPLQELELIWSLGEQHLVPWYSFSQ